MNAKKEKLLIENLLSSNDIFSRCIPIVKPEYFIELELGQVVEFARTYFNKHHAVPSCELIEAECDINLKQRTITRDEFDYTCDELEKFSQLSGFKLAVYQSLDDIQHNDVEKLGPAWARVNEAMLISLQRDLGVEFYENPNEYLTKLLETAVKIPTHIKGIDNALDGGMSRRQFTLFSANSGVGKSNMLMNLAVNFSVKEKLNVLYISIELPEDMIYLRLAAMSTTISTRVWKTSIPLISNKIIELQEDGAGSILVHRHKMGMSVNDLRSYLKHYEIECGYVPDVILVDYLGKMEPNSGLNGRGISETDEEIANELFELGIDYNAIMASACQQNREGLKMASPDQGVIAGGLSKVNPVDNYASLFMNDVMKLRGEMIIHWLKTRSSDGTGRSAMLDFNTSNLIISDPIRKSQLY